ncbi:phage tail tape measure protein [Sphingomonas koreensis]|uniref:phage tail tape measure protein n=1 Tax=Sphingomonas koreensis TaxID=93064 RepID=UPI000F7F4B61|nr:phage tail tape measure protein [Sphingomonas koreensis]RSU21200.1 phage tail tape measure protein [Sphingomonas koreensis]RSU32235.1 phage tail tape measure protein [Sphingomonas koreensis]RSU35729.1 phage tail tape measure protein [Sphingomonas koreensis]RSU49900.1 phage tail tape measure protein [Sphingomonas koreensis]RSU83497.1 phage tail tape measure protein [Sphingomonas koreensis]
MASTAIGAARVDFGADTSEFKEAAQEVRGVLRQLVDQFRAVEADIRKVGAGLTVGITLPFAAMVRAVDRGAGSFEAQMKRVSSALPTATRKQLEELADTARALGPAVGKGATEAASGIDELGRAGMEVSEILGGGLKATLDLAAAGQVDVSKSAALVTDALGQFKLRASNLPAVVRDIVGAVDGSKFSLEDFQLAISQGGGVAAAAGVNFTDFATAIAATSVMFSSGSDAGTSFKTYIQTLVGKSKEAKAAMAALGIQFFDANGKMKSLAEQSQILLEALSGLSDQDRTEALETIFGADAARTAIGLMSQGYDQFMRLKGVVEKGDVSAKIAKTLEGSEAAGRRIATAWESLKVTLGIDVGILAVTTAIKNAFASVLEAISRLHPVVLGIGVAFGALSAVLGPILFLLGSVGAFILASFVRGFGLIGTAISFIISPLSTVLGLLGEAGLMRALTMIGSRLLVVMGPLGWAAAAIIAFKDHIATALSIIWARMSETLGPPLQALFAKVTAIFDRIGNGPIGAALSALVSLLGQVADVIGTLLGVTLVVFGEVLIKVVEVAIALLGGLAEAVGGVVDTISALLTGDFAGAWDAALGIVDSIISAIIDVLAVFAPEADTQLRLVYEAAKAWLGDAFASVCEFFANLVRGAVAVVEAFFPGIVAAAKSVYEGVKAWLVDRFGWIVDWVKSAARAIGAEYQALKEKLGFGKATATAEVKVEAPKEPSWVDKLKRDFTMPGKPKKAGGGGGGRSSSGAGSGKSAAELAADREELRIRTQIEAARERGDHATAQRLQDQLELQRQIEAYQRTGLSLTAARAAAEADYELILAARRDGMKREADERARMVAIDVARMEGNDALAMQKQREQEIAERIEYFERQLVDIADARLRKEAAIAQAMAEQAKYDAARAAQQQRWLDDHELRRQIDVARARGDSEETIRQLERQLRIRREIEDLVSRGGKSPEEARKQAEASEEEYERARQQGQWRDTFRGALRAALDGNLGDFVKNWWKDRIAKALENALNTVSDALFNVFKGLLGGGKSGGGLFDFGSILGSIFNPGGTPGFKDGGSFRVGGMSGIDRNLVSFRASKGEIVDIRKPGNDNGGVGGIGTMRVEIVDTTGLFETRVNDISGNNVRQGLSAYDRVVGDRVKEHLARRD